MFHHTEMPWMWVPNGHEEAVNQAIADSFAAKGSKEFAASVVGRLRGQQISPKFKTSKIQKALDLEPVKADGDRFPIRPGDIILLSGPPGMDDEIRVVSGRKNALYFWKQNFGVEMSGIVVDSLQVCNGIFRSIK